MQKQLMTSQQVFDQYKEGRRDFSNIKIIECDLSGKNLEGIILKNSDLIFATFRGSNISNSDFSNAKMLWADISKCTMTNANFSGVNLEWAGINRAIFKNTNFRNANISNTSIFGVNRGGADFTGANLTGAWWSPADITLEGIVESLEKLKSMGLPFHLFREIKATLEAFEKKWEKHHGLANKEHKIKSFYERIKKEEKQTSSTEYGGGLESTYTKESEYGSGFVYGAIKKRLNEVLDRL